MTLTLESNLVDLEELFATSLPCQGIIAAELRRTCDRPADLVLVDTHDCRPKGARAPYKCQQCWRDLRELLIVALMQRGHLSCRVCGRSGFASIDDFVQYRPI